ncbi:MAG: hypothetical protein F6J98_15255 [Moorea sp. SIO4G2]|nr:hypothetical protein [Moorena sp. SIO3F7]NEO61713.1 hypothetical protein [Moorena sp. SIO4G2]
MGYSLLPTPYSLLPVPFAIYLASLRKIHQKFLALSGFYEKLRKVLVLIHPGLHGTLIDQPYCL